MNQPEDKSSSTPRTDAAEFTVEARNPWPEGSRYEKIKVVGAEDARQLERELAFCKAAHAELVRLAGGPPPPGHESGDLSARPSVVQPRPRGDVMDLAYGIIEGDDNWTAARIVANELIRLECAPSHALPNNVAPQEIGAGTAHQRTVTEPASAAPSSTGTHWPSLEYAKANFTFTELWDHGRKRLCAISGP